MKEIPVWADGVDPEIVARVIRDHFLYQGLKVKTSCVNIAPDGWRELREPIRVTIGSITYLEQNDCEYIDVEWSVEIDAEDVGKLSPVLPIDELDPYIRGISYRVHKGVLTGHYRGFIGQFKQFT